MAKTVSPLSSLAAQSDRVILRLWLFVVLTLAGAFAPSHACAHVAENRIWNFFPGTTESRPESAPQVADPHQGNLVCGYELAPGYSQAAESAVPRTIGEILPGAHPDTMIHLTPFEEGSFVNGVDHGTYFARLKDVSSMTIEQYQADVVGRAAAAAPGQPVSAFITSAPGSGTFLEAGVFNNAGVMEHTNSGLLTSFKYVPIW